jgi:hypothetical protein
LSERPESESDFENLVPVQVGIHVLVEIGIEREIPLVESAQTLDVEGCDV